MTRLRELTLSIVVAALLAASFYAGWLVVAAFVEMTPEFRCIDGRVFYQDKGMWIESYYHWRCVT